MGTYGHGLLGSTGNSVGAEGKFSQTEHFRMKIWMENKAKIEKHNRLAHKGHKSYHMAMNQFGDLLHHEFTAIMNGYQSRSKFNYTGTDVPLRGAKYLPPAHITSLPENVDWREHGAVTPVKNQGQCGSCWSFSTTGALEAMHHRATGVLTSLSEQNLVDCSRKYGNQGCNGGLMDAAFQYIKDNGGIVTEKSYPYEGEDDQCRYNPRYKGAWDVGFVDVEAGNENALKLPSPPRALAAWQLMPVMSLSSSTARVSTGTKNAAPKTWTMAFLLLATVSTKHPALHTG